MDIIWHGHSCFTLKGEDAVIVTDPYNGLGSTLPKLKAHVVTFGDAHAQSVNAEAAEVEGSPKILDWPGEFEVAGVNIEALAQDQGNIFLFNIDGMKVCHLGGLAHELSDETLELIGDVDILLIPVGGGSVLDAKPAQRLVEAIEPRVVIPMYFMSGESKMDIQGPSEFLKAVGKSNLEPLDKFTVKGRATLPEESMEFVLLEPQLKS